MLQEQLPDVSNPRRIVIHAQERDELSTLDWVRKLEATPSVQRVKTAGALPTTRDMPEDNLVRAAQCHSLRAQYRNTFTALISAGLLRDTLTLYDSDAQQYHLIVALSEGVCRHRGIAHGGMNAMIIDEALGVLVHLLKRDGVLAPGPAFTAHLGIDYKKPLPVGTTVVCTTALESVDGRKGWVTAELRDRPDGDLFSSARALFILARKPAPQPDGEVQHSVEPATA